MAIRSGTGGLKYPLPANTDNQASIAAASAGGSASSSAYGANRRYAGQKMAVQAQLANSAAERQFRAMSQLEGQQFRAQSQLEGQRFQGEQSQLGRDFQAEQGQLGRDFQAEQGQLGRDFTTGRDATRFEQEQIAFEREQDAKIEEGIRKGELELSPKQQKTLNEIDSALDDPKGGYSPEQRAEIQEKRRELIRGAKKPQGPTSTATGNKDLTYYDPQQGKFFEEPGEGRMAGSYDPRTKQFTPTIDAPDTSRQEKDAAAQQKSQQDWLEKRADEYTSQTNPETKNADGSGGRLYTLEEAIKKAQADRAVFDKSFGTQQSPGAPPEEQAPDDPREGAAAGAAGSAGGVGAAGQPSAQQPAPAAPAIPGARPEPEVQSVVSDIRSETKDLPIGEGETPEMRSFLESNLDNIVRYSDVPLDQVPEEARPAVDFYGRYTRSALEGQPIVLRTPDEAAMLPPDTPFIDDQGNERRTKTKRSTKEASSAQPATPLLDEHDKRQRRTRSLLRGWPQRGNDT